MNLQKNVPLGQMTTFGIGGRVKYFVKVRNKKQLEKCIAFSKREKTPLLVIGEGSNVLISDKGLNALIVHLTNKEIKASKTNRKFETLEIGSGVNWDDLVKHCVQKKLQGIECLSGIPGTVGAAPVQNIGAYGQELKDVFVKLEAYDLQKNKFVYLNNKECKFSYRESIFKRKKGRHIIYRVFLRLNKNKKPLTAYADLKGLIEPSLFTVRKRVLKIRREKLEDPKEFGNAGSYFKNPIVLSSKLNSLMKRYPDAPSYVLAKGKHKVPAGWLVEKCGFKGESYGNVAVSPKHALVIINKSGKARASEVLKLQKMIQEKVKKEFGILLEPEVQYIAKA